jgi:DNA modification methylase/ParB-like chromosome segregation protein Spo0J
MKIPLSQVQPHPLNETIYDLSNIDDLVVSIGEVGLLTPVVVNQQYQLISGHRRIEAVRRLGWDEVDVEVIETASEDEEKSLLVHFNKQRVKTSREIINEAETLRPLYAVGQGKRSDLTSVPRNKSGRDALAEAVGVSSSQLGKLLFIQKENPDFINAIDEGKLTVRQAYTHLSRLKNERDAKTPSPKKNNQSPTESFVFHHKSSDLMEELETDSIDLIFTSPPYWNKRDYGGVSLGTERSPDEFVDNLVIHLGACSRVIKETGSFFLNMGDTYKDRNLMNIPHKVVIKLQEDGWILRNTIIWNKTNPKPHSSKTSLSPTYEFIFHLVRSSKYKYNQTLAPSKTDSKFQFPRHREVDGSVPDMVYPMMPRDGKNMGDFWDESVVKTAVAKNISTPESVEHPAPFPEQIVTLPILQTTDEGDIVLDPFMGSGTTGKVANRLGRRFVGYDVTDY